MFDGPNIILKLHVDRVYTLQDIAIFIFGPFGLKLPIHAPFGFFCGLLPPNEFQYYHNPKRTMGACPRKIQYNINQVLTRKSHKTVIFHLSGEKPHSMDLNENLH